MTNPLKSDYFLRVKPGSSLGRMLNAFEEKAVLTGTELISVGGQKQSPWLLSAGIASNFDNLSVERPTRGATYEDGTYKVNYIDVVGRHQTVVNVQSAEFSGAGSNQSQQADFEEIRWPTATTLIDSMDFFRKPSWFEPMRAMVRQGKHISLSGPPGVGKDTAVMELAAVEKQPLVVIGGDAGLRKRDLVGSVELQNGSSYFQVAEFAAAAVNGWWALITEVNAAEPDALLLLNGIVETPHVINIHGKAYPVHSNFRLFISYNPGLIGTRPLPQSFKDRFFPIQVGFLTETELRKRLEAHGMPKVADEDYVEDTRNHKVVDKSWQTQLVKFGLALWEDSQNGKLRFQITVRRLKDAADLMNSGLTTGIKQAINWAVLATIDSPVEQKVAERTLADVMEATYFKGE